ncbi:MAG TPA: glycosyltransferase family 39 protein [Chthoniobacterales bacterium]
MAQSASGCATLDTTLVDTQKTPVDRRVLIGLLLALTVLLHVATAGWGPLNNGSEGIAAATARSMIEKDGGWLHPDFAGQEIVPDDWLSTWLTATSFQILGRTEFAARLPQALGVLLMVWWIFLIGERPGGTWRGMAAGLIATTCIGAFPYGNAAGGGTLWAALVTGALYYLCRCLEQVPDRKPFVLRFWLLMALCVWVGPPAWFIYPFAIIGLLIGCFRTARMRLGDLRKGWGLWLFGFVLVVRLWLTSGSGFRELATASSVPPQAVFWYFFPWALVVLLPFLLRCKKVLRVAEMEATDALPWIWLALTPLVFGFGHFDILVALSWPAFAICAVIVWERITSRMRLFGIGLLLATAIAAFFAMPHFTGKEMSAALSPGWWLSCGAIIAFGLVAFAVTIMGQSRAALLAISAAVIPLGFNLLDAQKHVAEWTSGRSLAEVFLPATHEKDVLYTNENPATISGFLFYWRGDVKRLDQIAPAKKAFLLVPKASYTGHGKRLSENASHVLLLQEPGQ